MIIIENRKTIGMTLLGAASNGVIVSTIGLLFGYSGPGDLPTESWTPRLYHPPQSFYVSTPGSASAMMVDRSGFTWR